MLKILVKKMKIIINNENVYYEINDFKLYKTLKHNVWIGISKKHNANFLFEECNYKEVLKEIQESFNVITKMLWEHNTFIESMEFMGNEYTLKC